MGEASTGKEVRGAGAAIAQIGQAPLFQGFYAAEDCKVAAIPCEF
jgi:hypothetical protein